MDPRKMTAKEFRAVLDKLGLSQMDITRLLHLEKGGRTARRWAERGVVGPAAILMWLLADGKITIKQIEKNHDR
jgi:hypothetical protein